MSSPTNGGTPPPQSGARSVHTPRAIGAIPAKPPVKKTTQPAKPKAKPAPKRKK